MIIWPFKKKLKIDSAGGLRLIEVDTSKEYIAICSNGVNIDDVIAFGDMCGAIKGVVRVSK